MMKVINAKKLGILAAVLVLVIMTISICSGSAGSSSRFTGKWVCTDGLDSGNSSVPIHLTLDFYDMKGDSGRCNITEEMYGSSYNAEVRVKGDKLVFIINGAESEDCTITWHGSRSFTMYSDGTEALFKKQ